MVYYSHIQSSLSEVSMSHDEKVEKACKDFSKLNDEQQDYVLGILQALVFAKNTGGKGESENPES